MAANQRANGGEVNAQSIQAGVTAAANANNIANPNLIFPGQEINFSR